jgi:eukaryotic-like serine/threonine-protein kinase
MPAYDLEDSDPRQVGPYRLTGRLGEGGQGVVYLAVAPDGTPVAVKLLKIDSADPAADRTARRRLAEEVAAAMRVDEFCTAKVLDSSVEGTVPYVVSEYVDGPSLQERVERRGPLAGGELTRLMITTASGLTAIHGAGVVHRDLKPSNVLLGPDGARVVDFGIARPAGMRTHTGNLIGTPSYFAPEQLLGESASTASDVFAWAGTMVFAATGRAPFGHADYEHELPLLFERIRTAEPDVAGVPDRLLPLLGLCLSKDPHERPQAWNILSWLVNPAARVVEPGTSVDQVTQNARDLLEGAVGDYWTQLPPPMPPPEPVQVGPGRAEQSAPRPLEPMRSTGTSGQLPTVPAGGDTVPPDGSEPPRDVPPRRPSQVSMAPPPNAAPAHPARPKRWLRLAAGVGTVLVLAGAGWKLLGGGSGEGIPSEYAGTWAGEVNESDGLNNRKVNVTLSLADGSKAGTLAGSRCAGGLELAGTEGGRLTFMLTSGDCQGGSVLTRKVDSGLDYELRGGGSATGGAVLTKTG